MKTSFLVTESMDDIGLLLKDAGRVVAIIDRNVGALHHQNLPPCERIFIDASEQFKTLDTVSYVASRLLEMEADRSVFLIGIGGGITTDITGFIASVYKRGVRFAFVPTTLLAQVDAAIGGKNGVNHRGFKNILGTFALPDFTLCCTSFLKTLSPREVNCGLAELLKTFIIGDAEAYGSAIRLFEGAQGIPEGVGTLIKRAAAIKSGIVEADFRDTGERMKLNLGHTFAHAIEKCASEDSLDISHGEAVSAGIVMAAELSEKLGAAPRGLASRIREDFVRVGLPVEHPFDRERIYCALRNDKKRDGDTLNFITVAGIGDVRIKKLHIEEVRL